jgi:hypothetical protein
MQRQMSAQLQRRYGRAQVGTAVRQAERRPDNRIIDEGCQVSSANVMDAGQDGER